MVEIEGGAAPDPAVQDWGALRIIAAALAFRLFSAVLAMWTNIVFPLDQPLQFSFGPVSPFWDAFARYDSGAFYQIARYGYTEGPNAYVAGGRSTIAYFPVYPLLMRYVGRLFGRAPADFFLGGVIVSWVAFAVAMVFLLRLAKLDLPTRLAGRAVLLAAVFPFAFFFGVVYTEATFLVFAIAAFYLFRTRRWIAGGICGGLATATRVNGILILPALAWFAWQAAEPTPRQRIWAAAGLVLVASGFGAYCFYIYTLSGNPFEWAHVITLWGDSGYKPGGAPWLVLARIGHTLLTHPYAFLTTERLAPYDSLNALAAMAFVVATPLVWWRFGTGYGLLMAANLWLPLSSGQVEGLGRYCAVMFPFFIWLASVRSRTVFFGALIAFGMLYTLCLALFTTIHPLF